MSGWFVIRPPREQDTAFLALSWLNSYLPAHWAGKGRETDYLRHSNRRLYGAVKRAYFRDHSPRVNDWLSRGTVLVAALEADQDIICGWACGERDEYGSPVLHYCYVKHGYRRQGIARALVGELLERLGKSGVVRSHDSRAARQIEWARSVPVVPFIVFGRESEATQG